MEIDFGDEIETAEQIAVGATATVDGSPASGDYVLPSGEVYVFESGSLTEIKPVEEEGEENEEVEALKAENEQLKEQIADVQNKLDTVTNEKNELDTKFSDVSSNFDSIKNEFEAFKGKFSNEKPEVVIPSGEEDKGITKATFNKDKIKNQKNK
jgi:chromosome segregation ATPase